MSPIMHLPVGGDGAVGTASDGPSGERPRRPGGNFPSWSRWRSWSPCLIKSVSGPAVLHSVSIDGETLHGCAGCSGDRILVNKPIYYLRDPHPGDIVVFRAPTDVWFNEPLPATPSNPDRAGFALVRTAGRPRASPTSTTWSSGSLPSAVGPSSAATRKATCGSATPGRPAHGGR